MKNPALFALLLATSTLGVHAQSLDPAQSHNVPMITTEAGEVGFAAPDWTPSALSVHAQSTTAANPYDVPMSDEGNQAGAEDSGNMIYPVTQPTLAFSDRQHAVQISGVVTNDGKPVPGATVNVEVELDGDFVNINTINADNRGFYTIRVPAPAKISAVRVEADGFCSVKNGCDPLGGTGAGAIAQ